MQPILQKQQTTPRAAENVLDGLSISEAWELARQLARGAQMASQVGRQVLIEGYNNAVDLAHRTWAVADECTSAHYDALTAWYAARGTSELFMLAVTDES